MRQVGAELPIRFGFLDRVTVDTGSRKENVTTGAQLWIVNRRLLLCCHPFLKIIRRMGNDAEQHACMLQAAILGAVADIGAWLCWLDPHLIAAGGDQIDFSGELWHPETVCNNPRLELQ